MLENSLRFYAHVSSQLSCCLRVVFCFVSKSAGRCVCVNNLLFHTCPPPPPTPRTPPHPHLLSSLRAMCVILAGSEKLQANICLPVWQSSTMEGRELFSPSAGALQWVRRWDGDICSWLQLTTCFCLLIPSDVIKLANEYHLWWFYRRSGHILRGCLGNTKNRGSCK